tara:strand:+ start:62590 stop:63177 length:588 start_codon:yes stop_codon:yes gene_type:complete
MNDLYDKLKEDPLNLLYHFTPVENLESILQHGILSRSTLDKMKIPYVWNDQQRYDGKFDRISISPNRTNRRYLRRMIKKYPARDFVRITIFCKILFDDKFDCLFYPDNAASKKFSGVPENRFKGLEALERFLESSSNPDDGIVSLEQREIMALGPISTNCFSAVIFLNPESFSKFRSPLLQKRINAYLDLNGVVP